MKYESESGLEGELAQLPSTLRGTAFRRKALEGQDERTFFGERVGVDIEKLKEIEKYFPTLVRVNDELEKIKQGLEQNPNAKAKDYALGTEAAFELRRKFDALMGCISKGSKTSFQFEHYAMPVKTNGLEVFNRANEDLARLQYQLEGIAVEPLKSHGERLDAIEKTREYWCKNQFAPYVIDYDEVKKDREVKGA